MRQNLHLLILIVLFFLPACTIQKRLYRGGWHVEWRKAHNHPGAEKEPVLQDQIVSLDRISESEQFRNTEDSVLTKLSDTMQNLNQPKETVSVIAAKSELYEAVSFKSGYRKMKPVAQEFISVKKPSEKYYWSRSTKTWSVVLLILFTVLLLVLLYFGILSTEFVLFSGGLFLMFFYIVGVAIVLVLFFVLFAIMMARPTQESIDQRNEKERTAQKQEQLEQERLEQLPPEARAEELRKREEKEAAISRENGKSRITVLIIGAFLVTLFLLTKKLN